MLHSDLGLQSWILRLLVRLLLMGFTHTRTHFFLRTCLHMILASQVEEQFPPGTLDILSEGKPVWTWVPEAAHWKRSSSLHIGVVH